MPVFRQGSAKQAQAAGVAARRLQRDVLRKLLLSRIRGASFHAGRPIVALPVGRARQPLLFYRSKHGTSGKLQSTWYPFFGIHTDGWFIKGRTKGLPMSSSFQMERGYGIPGVKKYQEQLNQAFGPKTKLPTVVRTLKRTPNFQSVEDLGRRTYGQAVFNVPTRAESQEHIDRILKPLMTENMKARLTRQYSRENAQMERIWAEIFKQGSASVTTKFAGLLKLAGEQWIGVDLDGTLAAYNGFKGEEHIGDPIPKMVKRVRRWLASGKKVKIFTARAGKPKAEAAIKTWCKEHLGRTLPITNVKDRWMSQLWDDRAVTVERNTGEKQAQEFAPGIMDKSVYGDVLGTLKPGDITDFVLQHHATQRNPKHPHYDLRLGTKDTNLFSWAVPNATLPGPGEIKRPLPQTQLHTYQYGSFSGKIDCVVAGTLITCADGPHPIEKLQPDRDEVHVLGLGSRGLTFYRVQRLYRNVTRHQWLRLCVKAANGELHTLVCGPEHGLYRLGQGFIRAKDITVGHTVALHHGTEPLFQHIMAAGADQYEISRVMGGADDPGHQMVHAQILGHPATTADTVTCSHNAYRTLPVLPVHRPCVIDGTPTHCARPAQSLYSMALKRFLDTLSVNVQRVRDLCLAKTFVKVHSAQGCGVAECWRRTVTQYLCCAFARCTEILHNQCAQLFMLVRRSAGIQAFTYDYAASDAKPVRDLCEGQSGPQQRQNLSFVERTAPTHLSPQLSDTNGISWGTIVQVESVTESQEAFDLLVDDAHNYFAQGLLVHNSGYGAGTVTMADKGKAIITRVTPNTLHFTLGHTKVPTRYVLVHIGGRDGKMWQMIAKPEPGKVPGVDEKPIYKQISAVDQDEAIAQATELQEKIDGAHGILNVGPKGDVDIYSVRSRTTGQPISHSERMGLFGLRLPQQYRNSAYRGEMYFVDEAGKSIPFKNTSGLLNTLPAKSLEAQRAQGLKPRVALFDTVQVQGKRLDGTPLTERQQRLREVLKELPPEIFHEPASASDDVRKRQLVSDIREGRNPRTSEGVMAVMPDGSMRKIKNKEEATGYLTGTYPGTGKRKGTAGGLTFVTDRKQKGGSEGRVGTGFTDRELQDIVANLEQYLGKPIRLEHQGQFGSGRLRAPSFKGFETDKNAAAKPADVRFQFTDTRGRVKAAATIEIADTFALRRRGLSKRAALPPNHGMFFDKAGTYWMKDVEFPLDLVFVDKHGTILEKQSMPVDPVCTQLYSSSNKSAAHAIELPLGWIDKHGIKAGDKVKAVA